MTVECIRPTEVEKQKGIKIFLAGPIQGTDDWQQKAIELLTEKLKSQYGHYIICSPRSNKGERKFSFNEQVDWETLNLSEAEVIMFFLAEEKEHFPDRAYAQTTRFELAEWLTKDPGKVVIGLEGSFSGIPYILRRLQTSSLEEVREMRMGSGLEDTVQKVIMKLSLK